MMGDCCGAGMWWGGLLWILLLAVIVAGGILLVRSLWGSSSEKRSDRADAVEVLEERFARGDIDREDFEERRRILTSSSD